MEKNKKSMWLTHFPNPPGKVIFPHTWRGKSFHFKMTKQRKIIRNPLPSQASYFILSSSRRENGYFRKVWNSTSTVCSQINVTHKKLSSIFWINRPNQQYSQVSDFRPDPGQILSGKIFVSENFSHHANMCFLRNRTTEKKNRILGSGTSKLA